MLVWVFKEEDTFTSSDNDGKDSDRERLGGEGAEQEDDESRSLNLKFWTQ
jgi:hypothetical protein